MAKIDEIVSLMTEEIDNFEKAVNKIEELNKNLSEIDLKPDLGELHIALHRNVDEHIKRQERSLEALQDFVTKTVESQKQPRWLIISKLSLAFLSLLFVFYSFYKIGSIQDLERSAFDKWQEHVLSHIKKFFSENEEASKLYDEWVKKIN